jgi:hypothetical protein
MVETPTRPAKPPCTGWFSSARGAPRASVALAAKRMARMAQTETPAARFVSPVMAGAPQTSVAAR